MTVAQQIGPKTHELQPPSDRKLSMLESRGSGRLLPLQRQTQEFSMLTVNRCTPYAYIQECAILPVKSLPAFNLHQEFRECTHKPLHALYLPPELRHFSYKPSPSAISTKSPLYSHGCAISFACNAKKHPPAPI